MIIWVISSALTAPIRVHLRHRWTFFAHSRSFSVKEFFYSAHRRQLFTRGGGQFAISVYGSLRLLEPPCGGKVTPTKSRCRKVPRCTI
jgi:hypothetical protein